MIPTPEASSPAKQYYRSLDALLIDDIQFFAKKEQSQEELFHTFNSLLEKGSQMILTCDRYPKEIDGLEDRLKSRLGWGLPVVIEPPELETRVAILLKKAESMNQQLNEESAFFIAQKVNSNVRELAPDAQHGVQRGKGGAACAQRMEGSTHWGSCGGGLGAESSPAYMRGREASSLRPVQHTWYIHE